MKDKNLYKSFLELKELFNNTIKKDIDIFNIIDNLFIINYFSKKLEQWNKWYELLLDLFFINENYIEDIFYEFDEISNTPYNSNKIIESFIQKYNLKLITETWLLSFEENLIIE